MLLADTRVLVVDDERHVRMLMRVLLESEGATVVEASDGEQAWKLLQTSPAAFDVVVTDLTMPRMDGAQLVCCIREQIGSGMPVVVCSANPDLDGHNVMRAGLVQATVVKPFSPPVFLSTVARALGLEERRQAQPGPRSASAG